MEATHRLTKVFLHVYDQQGRLAHVNAAHGGFCAAKGGGERLFYCSMARSAAHLYNMIQTREVAYAVALHVEMLGRKDTAVME